MSYDDTVCSFHKNITGTQAEHGLVVPRRLLMETFGCVGNKNNGFVQITRDSEESSSLWPVKFLMLCSIGVTWSIESQ